jgi:hypothetical protein
MDTSPNLSELSFLSLQSKNSSTTTNNTKDSYGNSRKLAHSKLMVNVNSLSES